MGREKPPFSTTISGPGMFRAQVDNPNERFYISDADRFMPYETCARRLSRWFKEEEENEDLFPCSAA